ncbi:MAG: tRNA preQ1(34) S-adenosylmethionine ribosyltransferase-isomerase QueA [bacterium]
MSILLIDGIPYFYISFMMQDRLIDFTLPSNLIADAPSQARDQSRLMLLSLPQKRLSHYIFKEIEDLLYPGDMLILNDTKVLKARLFCTRESGGRVEVLLLQTVTPFVWQALIKPSKKLSIGEPLYLSNDCFFTLVKKEAPFCHLRLPEGQSAHEIMAQFGVPALPPYIRHSPLSLEDQISRYQTIYADKEGAVAAPTAGLHFTEDLLTSLRAKGVCIETVTLHVGYGTFQPLEDRHFQENKLHNERFYISDATATRLMAHRQRRIAVGTTTIRALESAWTGTRFRSGWQETTLFIQPGYRFSTCQGLITNFHLPKSSLLLLVAAFSDVAFLQEAYQTAIAESYRFYSFGDVMFLSYD